MIGYARTPEDAERLQRLVVSHGLEVVEIRVEPVGIRSLAGLRRITAEIDAGDLRSLVVLQLAGLGRTLHDALHLVELVLARGVELLVLIDGIDSTTAHGRRVLETLRRLSQWGREQHSDATKAKLGQKLRAGLYVGGAPYGWRKVTGPDGKQTALERVDIEQRAIAVARKLDREGRLTQTEIAQQLTERGYPTRSGRPWSRRGVQCLLGNAA